MWQPWSYVDTDKFRTLLYNHSCQGDICLIKDNVYYIFFHVKVFQCKVKYCSHVCEFLNLQVAEY